MTKPKPVIGKTRIMVNYEGTKEVLTNIYEYVDIKEVRIDFDNNCVKILPKSTGEYEIVFEDTSKDQLIQFHRFLITSMSEITQDEIMRAREMAQKAQEQMQKNTKTSKKIN